MAAPGGYRVPASNLNTISDNLFCSTCGYVLREAVQTECGHLYCKICLDIVKRQNNPACSKCGLSLEQMESYPDRFVRREVAALKVTCINAGCGWNGNLECYDVSTIMLIQFPYL